MQPYACSIRVVRKIVEVYRSALCLGLRACCALYNMDIQVSVTLQDDSVVVSASNAIVNDNSEYNLPYIFELANYFLP